MDPTQAFYFPPGQTGQAAAASGGGMGGGSPLGGKGGLQALLSHGRQQGPTVDPALALEQAKMQHTALKIAGDIHKRMGTGEPMDIRPGAQQDTQGAGPGGITVGQGPAADPNQPIKVKTSQVTVDPNQPGGQQHYRTGRNIAGAEGGGGSFPTWPIVAEDIAATESPVSGRAQSIAGAGPGQGPAEGMVWVTGSQGKPVPLPVPLPGEWHGPAGGIPGRTLGQTGAGQGYGLNSQGGPSTGNEFKLDPTIMENLAKLGALWWQITGGEGGMKSAEAAGASPGARAGVGLGGGSAFGRRNTGNIGGGAGAPVYQPNRPYQSFTSTGSFETGTPSMGSAHSAPMAAGSGGDNGLGHISAWGGGTASGWGASSSYGGGNVGGGFSTTPSSERSYSSGMAGTTSTGGDY